jgi:indolepyruvate ferredoxin oxidoreductase alpha subunit
MSKLGEKLIQTAGFAEIVMGNTAVVRAMLEAGVQVVTSYPGSPTPEIAETIAGIPKDKNPLYFEYSTNEKVATEVAFGASVNGHLSCVFFKSVGLNVAADTFVQLSHMELIGGMIIILGDDPGANSSQNEQDNRHYARLSYTPVFEPASPTEVYTMFKTAAKVSADRKMPVILRLTTHVCHAKEKVSFAAYSPKPIETASRFSPENGPYIPITSLVFPMKRKALQKLADVAEYAETSAFNEAFAGTPARGIITMGAPYLSLCDALEEIEAKPGILKLGIVHPLPRRKIIDFLKAHREVKILEELDDVIEQQIKAWAYDEGLKTRIIGKACTDDWMGEYTPEKVEAILRQVWPDLLPPAPKLTPVSRAVVNRPAQMCPGCGHRSAYHAIKQALKATDITVADIGCHTLGFLPPYNVGQVLLCMGHSCGTGAGLSLRNTERRVVAFLGDSTFFHAGLPGIINALYNRHNLTLIVMENGTTAMTGHQNHPGTGANFNAAVDAIPIRRVLEGLGVQHIFEVDTYQQKKLTELVTQALALDGFKVVIARHACMLKFTRENHRKGKAPPPPVHVSDACSLKKTCIGEFACPTYQFADDGAVFVHPDLCIGDGSCIQTCASRAIVPAGKGGKSE